MTTTTTPNPHDPQPGDLLFDKDGDLCRITSRGEEKVLYRWSADDGRTWSDECIASLAPVATWTPVAPTSPDVWRVVWPGGSVTYYDEAGAVGHAQRVPCGAVWRYAAVEQVEVPK